MKRSKIYISGLILAVSLIGLTALFSINAARAAEGTIVTGKVVFEGTAPPAQTVRLDADPVCALKHANGMASEEVVVNSNGTLKNVLVYVKQGLEGQKFEAPKEAVSFNQTGCHYEPHVFGIQVNQPLEILNSDETLHNVHALPKNSKEFNLGMPIQGMKLKKNFTSPEVPVKIKCEVHPWMNAWAGVFEHPFFSVTGDDGTFSLKGLPPGQYTLEAWHEKYGTQTATVKVPEQTEVSFTFKG